MENTTEAPAAPDTSTETETAAITAPEVTQPESISGDEATSAIDKMSAAELNELLEAANDPERKPAKPAKEKTEPEQVVETETEQVETETSEETDTEEVLPKNFRFHTEDPQRARFLKLMKQEPGADPIELARRAGYSLPKAEAAQEIPQTKETAAVVDPLKAQREEIAELEKKIKTANELYEYTEAGNLIIELNRKERALERAEDQLQSQQQSQAGYQAAYEQSLAKALKACPEASVVDSPQFKAIKREMAYIEANEPDFMKSPDYPVLLLERMKKERPDLFKGTPAKPVVPPVKPNAPVTTRPVVGSVTRGNANAEQITEATALAAIENLNLEQLEALGNQVGQKRTR